VNGSLQVIVTGMMMVMVMVMVVWRCW